MRVVPFFIHVHGASAAATTGLDLVFFAKHPTYLRPHVIWFDSVVVNPVWDAIDGNLSIGDVGAEEVFSVPVTRCVR